MDSTKLSDLPNYGGQVGDQEYAMPVQQPHMQPTVFPPNPEVITRQFPDDVAMTGLGKTNYVPLNIHPNPYQSPPPPSQEDMAPPPVIESMIPSSAKPIEDSYVPPQIQHMPQSDMSITPLDYMQDEQIKPNYIPPPDPLSKIKVNDYIKEYDETEGVRLYEHELEKSRKKWHEQLYQDAQNPLLLFLLLFVFQMHVIKRVMMFYIGRFTGKWIFRDDGTITVLGMLLKSLLFTATYVGMTWTLAII